MPPKKKNRSVTRKPKGWQAATAAAAAKGKAKRKITATKQKKGTTSQKKKRKTPSAPATPARSSLAATSSSAADSADALVPAAVLAAVQAPAPAKITATTDETTKITTAKIMTANSPSDPATPARSSPAATASSADSADALVPAAVLAVVQASAPAKITIPPEKRKAPSLSTRKRKKSAEKSPRKRPKKPSVNTCLVAKSRTVTEFIGNNHGGNASVKLTALQGLCLISEEHKWSIKCPICNAVLRTKIVVNFDLCKPVSQNDRDGKYAVRLIRQHCAEKHPDTWIWNVVPPTRIREGDGISPYEHFLHQALKAGGLNGCVPKKLTKHEFLSAFSMRIGSALSWIRWSRMMNKSLNKLQRIAALREDATRRIENILDDGMARILSPDFAKVLETHTLDQAFNKLMLFFCEMGRYRYCPIFGMQINELQAVAMLNSRLTRGENIRGNEADIPQSGVDDAQMDVWNL